MFRTLSLRSTTLSFLLVSCCLSGSFAQQRFSAGPRLGLNMSNYWGNADNMSFKPGVTAGVFLMYSSLNHFGISADLLYSQMGTKFADNRYKFTQHVNYLEIPVVARYFLTLSGNFRPNLFVGPSLAIKLNAKRTNGEIVSGPNTAVNADNTGDFNDLDLGATGGFQLNWGTGPRQRFLIDARYTLGLSNVQSRLSNLWGANNSLHNSAITVTLGYGFGVGREYPSRYRR
ncbi:porin family protein [Spirosoma sp. KNUC1025]|uniref:porin family protein n=1 Tax=Spirosoma sp. KNUC1025 TaxID=2894082 RepID=UPI0038667934|nr:PorT family protein [Spirosoma sp. KNUC1025]